MIDRDRLIALVHALRVLAAQAQQRGDLRRANNLPAEYWYGQQIGYQDAAEQLEALLADEQTRNE